MRTALLVSALLLVLPAAIAAADPLDLPSTSAPPVLPDPVPDNGTRFDPRLATAGTAMPDGVARGARSELPKIDTCSALNPCAKPTPADFGAVQSGDGP